jgi:hypothetical protein
MEISGVFSLASSEAKEEAVIMVLDSPDVIL